MDQAKYWGIGSLSFDWRSYRGNFDQLECLSPREREDWRIRVDGVTPTITHFFPASPIPRMDTRVGNYRTQFS
jgi:hypothetical protein